jgi:hypothetical protein
MDAIKLLKTVIDTFENYNNNNSKILEQLTLNNILHPSFEKRYILNNNVFRFSIKNIVQKDQNLVEFYLEASDGCPYKAEVIFDGQWYLRSLLFQCQSCFGGDSLCNVCGGSGWGVL